MGETRTRLARVGIENVSGYLEGGIRAWDAAGRPLARTEQIDVDELARGIAETHSADAPARDVRRPAEWNDGHIRRAASMPLHRLRDLAMRSTLRPVAAICAGGYRSSIATSVLRERIGLSRLTNVAVGGMAAWTGAKHETVTAG